MLFQFCDVAVNAFHYYVIPTLYVLWTNTQEVELLLLVKTALLPERQTWSRNICILDHGGWVGYVFCFAGLFLTSPLL